MTVEYLAGDLFADPSLRAFAHGCNCAGAMGRGVAVAFRQRWPEMYAAYKARCDAGAFRLGDVFTWEAPSAVVYNLGTQRTWRTKATLDAIAASMAAMLKDATVRGLPHVAMPRIGAGLGGLDWVDVREVLDRVAANAATVIKVCEEFRAGEPLRARAVD